MNRHSGIANRLQWMQQTYSLNAEDRVLQKTPYSFDVSVWEFFWPLLNGARLVIAKPEGHKDPVYLSRLIKHKQISDLFHRVGGFPEADVHPVVPCPQPYHYRNRIMVRTQWNREKKDMNVGFLRHDSRLVADVEHCWIAEEDLNEDLQVVRKDPPRRNGIKVVLRKFPEGWTLPPDSFFQNNFHLLPGLVDTVADRLKDSGATHLVDAYCGVGFFSMELANTVERYVGIEVDRMAIKAARANAETRNATNGEFIEGTTEEVLPELIQTLPADKTALVIDPPRKGCNQEFLDQLFNFSPRRVVYISCNPATQMRDLKEFLAAGYKLTHVQPFDLFPQTRHLECVIVLER